MTERSVLDTVDDLRLALVQQITLLENQLASADVAMRAKGREHLESLRRRIVEVDWWKVAAEMKEKQAAQAEEGTGRRPVAPLPSPLVRAARNSGLTKGVDARRSAAPRADRGSKVVPFPRARESRP